MPTITVKQFTGASFSQETFPDLFDDITDVSLTSNALFVADEFDPNITGVFRGFGFSSNPAAETVTGTVTSVDFSVNGILIATMSGFAFPLMDFILSLGSEDLFEELYAPFDFVLDARSVVSEETDFSDLGVPLGETAIAGPGGSYMDLNTFADTYIAGSGFDQISFANETGSAGVTVNLVTDAVTDTYGNAETATGQFESLRGSSNDDMLTGDGQRQHLRGLRGDDTLDGGGGGDLVRYDRDVDYGGFNGVMVDLGQGIATDGFGDTDTLLNIRDVGGTRFSDDITGNALNNVLEGFFGFDRLEGGAGDDTLNGGENADTASYANATSGVKVFLENSGNNVGGGQGRDVFISIENIEGSTHNDRLNGDNGANTFNGGAGDDIIKGEGGQDLFFGEEGNDKIRGGNDLDVIYGDEGNDILVGFAGTDTLEGGEGDDNLFGGSDDDFLGGGLGDDAIRGNRGNDRMEGSFGSDRMFGGSQNDNLSGGDGVDYLLGERGNDTLDGGTENDRLTGGTGADVFVMSFNGGYDIVRDFEDGSDLIDLSIFTLDDVSQLNIEDVASGTKIDIFTNVVLLLQGVSSDVLDNDDFLF